jgi:hypothetical protein
VQNKMIKSGKSDGSYESMWADISNRRRRMIAP